MNGANIDASPTAQHGAEVQRRQARLQGHQQRQQARQTTIAFAKRMNQNQLSMHLGQGKSQRSVARRSARRVLPERSPLKLRHQTLDEARVRELKASLADIDRTVLACPWVDRTEPQRVQIA